jgi:hypothetical protein
MIQELLDALLSSYRERMFILGIHLIMAILEQRGFLPKILWADSARTFFLQCSQEIFFG